jgi:NAD(P) transhydrogenase subunit alpha
MDELLIMIAVLAASFAVGYLLIARVPPLLHTPLMSLTNAISAVTVLGGLVLFSGETDGTETVLGALALPVLRRPTAFGAGVFAACQTKGLVTDLFYAPGPAVLTVLALWRASLILENPAP